MTPSRIAAGLMFILSCLSPPGPVAAETISLRPGFQKILDQPAVTRLSVGNPDVIEASPLPKGDGIIVVGKKEGETDLVAWSKGTMTEWQVRVREKRPALIDEVRALVVPFPDLSVREAGETVTVSGTVPTRQDKAFLENFSAGRPNLHMRISLPEEKRVLLSYDLKIIEISKGKTSQLGVRWPDSIAVKGSFTRERSSESALVLKSGFDAQLNLLLADGRARILANPRLVCESGADASFLAGGEIPIVIATPETRTVEWKTYGIILRITPKMDAGNRIRTRITAEISSVDHGSGSQNTPGFLTRRVTTFFSTPPGSTVMLSGLVKSEMAKDIAKLPLLGQIPVLGELFKSRSFRENRSELAIFITPREVHGYSREEMDSWDSKAEREKTELRYRLLD
ncbi:MAG: pilus assembly protein N-terminal domain-containing protein [Deltaproteobacteria bacterium]|nr:pilus assembly protein N-terminal domain-containing protein [Deltaproteobacteria bacterium]